MADGSFSFVWHAENNRKTVRHRRQNFFILHTPLIGFGLKMSSLSQPASKGNKFELPKPRRSQEPQRNEKNRAKTF
jgi:hypothetical protein